MIYAHSIPVLMYHHVSPAGGFISVTPENFDSQLAWLAQHGYRALTTDEFADHLSGRRLAPARSVLITFDDGYLDNWIYAYPLLKRHGYHATFFVVTGQLGEGPVRTEMPAHDTVSHQECEARIAQGQADSVMLRWSEVKAMRDGGYAEFHSHSHTHTRWDRVEAANKNQRMREELEQSREAFLAHFGEASEHLCWPQGYFDADYQRIAQEAGFRYLYTTEPFGQNLVGGDASHIYRFAVRNTHGASVGRRIQVGQGRVVGPLFHAWKRWRRAAKRS
ncbi:polysaccharide deacetylase family protein [Pusillimonas sp. CC-YST705]|uniref:Polysaccharide deacetylase family protein n=1 Tax=Mesopusillimonas faecipullorum TaxID=2755040 RepID=A0ABS8CFK9_9BURK|nr:polysaccharide deacetylase family protein [Mesopusillimonas faecipullorum]MCB5364836.1 polysaccharide deacetylase family protein [Mesopusillimonas faecipullorum]